MWFYVRKSSSEKYTSLVRKIECNATVLEGLNRLVTIREGLRLQSFPDNYNIISRNKRNYYLQVGNAVPPLLSISWAKHLKKFLG